MAPVDMIIKVTKNYEIRKNYPRVLGKFHMVEQVVPFSVQIVSNNEIQRYFNLSGISSYLTNGKRFDFFDNTDLFIFVDVYELKGFLIRKNSDKLIVRHVKKKIRVSVKASVEQKYKTEWEQVITQNGVFNLSEKGIEPRIFGVN